MATKESNDVSGLLESYIKLEELKSKILDADQQASILRKEEQKLLEDGNTELQVQLGLLQRRNKFSQDALKATKSLQEINDKILENLDGETEHYKEILDSSNIRKDLLEKELETREKIADETEREVKANAKNLAYIEDTKKKTDDMFGSLFGMTDRWKGSLLGNIFDGIEKGKFTTGFKSMGSSIIAMINPVNLLGGALHEAFTKMFPEQEQARAEFVKTTGVTGQYDEALAKLSHGYIGLGIDAKDATKAVIELRDSYSDFVGLSMEAQQETALFAASMDKLGISTKITSKNIDITTKVLGMSAEQSKKTQREIYTLATSIGVLPEKMASNFERMMPKLAVFGDRSVKVFKELSVLAKQTGIEMDSLLGIAEGFDTFEGAAESVGKLNAILGGPYLDSMQMVMQTDPTKRLENIQKAITDAGLSYESMSYYQQKALVASIPGMKSVDELSRLMAGDFQSLEEEANKEAKTQEDLNSLIRDARPLMEKMMDIMKQLGAVVLPILTDLAKYLGWFLDKLNYLGEITNGWVYKGIMLLGAALLINKIRLFDIGGLTSKVIGLFSGLGNTAASSAGKLGTLATQQGLLNQKTAASGPAAASSVGPMLAFGFAILMIGAGIFLAVYGLSLLATAIKGMSGEQMLLLAGILLVIVGGIVALAFVSAAAAIPVMAFGFGLLMVGAGVALIGLGLSLVINSIKGFLEMVIQNSAVMGTLALQIAELAIGFAAIALFGPAAALSLVAIAVGFGSLSLALWSIKTSDLQAVSSMFVAISNLSLSTASSISNIAGSIKEMISVIDTMPTNKALEFAYTFNSMSMVSTERVDNVKRLVDQAERYRTIVNDAKTTPSNQVASANQNQTVAPVSGGQSTIILELDGRVLKKFVIDTLNTQMNPRKI
ncbi:MAG: hypothetical protein Q8P81_02115 [Nanoarchaeota archaeon]|nr:hypothetical protein [Nanoarchaeota archaeon]